MTAVWHPGGRQAKPESPAAGYPCWILSWSNHRYGLAAAISADGEPMAGAWDPWAICDYWCYAAGPEKPANLPAGPPPGQPK